MGFKKRVYNGLFYLGVIAAVTVILFPFIWQVLTSFKSPAELWSIPPKWIPSHLYMEYYYSVLVKRSFLVPVKNSFIVAGSATILCILLSSFAAYALSRLKMKGKKLILSLFLAVSMFPGIAVIGPLYLFMMKMHLLNTYWALIIPYTAFNLPLALWNLTTFFKSIPLELEESARVDGATPLVTLARIIFPLAAPGVFTTAILTFIAAWNEFLFALVFNSKVSMRTVTVAIAMFPGQFDLPWGDMAAASVIVTVPLIIMVLVFQQRIISGLTAGAIKG
ncbi:carbohydrate ABC transporter membrane protein 2, CUT1 family [Thermanaeromonas toyohensis ToBE]|uniref:Carbohydrate ABC transporter membrane protein 2, CUT1 family n=1 Tax=Thermanaeromonas toyohensis ToBE TaxID=698762 RepID=A0A1W1W1A7_9FIRM|nr:carbohydrate ABC transporter permease [Thermanaeromonas toyohensis]SMB99407.1 carbohydrate ABC transporter membrane protein 2, CUT1 family [Thermanaeromonas toyohensis ToBE]